MNEIDKSRALFALRRAVKITRHDYERSPFSGAGNCWCGRARESALHPHVWVPSQISDGLQCVCGKPPNHRVHVDAAVPVGSEQGSCE